MTLLHDAAVRDSCRARIAALSASKRPKWGRMSVDQMLWHCNQVLKTSLGDMTVVPRRPPFPVPVLKFILFEMPWPHGMPTTPEFLATASHDFEAERKRCLELIDRFVARRIEDDQWGRPVFGKITGLEWSRLQAKHLDHHLRQFEV